MIKNRFLFLLWGKDMVTIQPIPSHKEAMTFSYAARSGTEVYSPTPSFCLHSLSPTPFQFTLCLCLPPSPQSAPREESCSWRVSIRLSRSLGSVTFVTWLITLGIKKKRLILFLSFVFFFLIKRKKKGNKAFSWA